MVLRKVNLLITGRPGCGKSTLISKIIKKLNDQGYRVGGITTPELRSPQRKRMGFLIRDISTDDEKIMASTEFQSELRVGRYGIDTSAIHTIGVAAINRAILKADIVVIDEIGKMEILAPEFQNCVTAALNSLKPVLATIGLYILSDFVMTIKRRPDVQVLELYRNQGTSMYQYICQLLGVTSTKTG